MRCIVSIAYAFLASASQISQRLKLTYKTSTSKIVSSFKQASQTCMCVRQYQGHRDGVWEVSGSRIDPQVIGSAAAGKVHVHVILIQLLWLHIFHSFSIVS